MNKRLMTTMGLAFMAVPLFAQAVSAAAYGAAAGAGIGSVVPGLGTIAGAIIGGLGGLIAGGIQSSQQKQADIKELEGTNTQLRADIGDQELALANWQSEYDTSIQESSITAQDNLDVMKQNWGLVNTTNAAFGQGGATAQLLSSKAKQRVIDYAGDDMELGSDLNSFYESIYANPNNFDADGNLTAEALNSIRTASASSKYGIYERQIGTDALGALQSRSNMQKTLTSNREALQNNIASIEKLGGNKRPVTEADREAARERLQAMEDRRLERNAMPKS